MEENLFILLGKYKPSESVTSEENYSTALLAYLLNYSLKKKTELFKNFMQLLGEDINYFIYDDFIIDTQKAFPTTTKNTIIPDLYIKRKKRERYYFVEVKIEAGLNYYKNLKKTNKPINQIQKYQSINKLEKNIYLLSKYVSNTSFDDCSDFKKQIRWHNIHKILKDYNYKDTVEKYLINETIKYMEDKNMSIEKVSHEIVKGMESLNNLMYQIEDALEGIPHKNSYGYYSMGYSLGVRKDRKDGLVGNEYDGSGLFFEYRNKIATKLIREKYSHYFEKTEKTEFYRARFDFEKEHYFCLTAEKQLEKLKKWINDNYKKLVKYSKE